MLEVILECSPLMIGGKESTVPFESRITGYTGDFSMSFKKGAM